MFKRWLQNKNSNISNSNSSSNSSSSKSNQKVKRKKRSSPLAGPGISIATASDTNNGATVIGMESTPGYHYAVKEFQQTIPAGSVDNDGSSGMRMRMTEGRTREGNNTENGIENGETSSSHPMQPSQSPLQQQQYPQDIARDQTAATAAAAGYIQAPDHDEASIPPQISSLDSGDTSAFQYYANNMGANGINSYHMNIPSSSFQYRARQSFPPIQNNYQNLNPGNGNVMSGSMADANYEEWYGDAYIGGPIKYLYPSGYQSMRPRGGPWRLSIGICLLFTWLSVFIIGHCSDQNNSYYSNQNGNVNGNNDDANAANDDQQLAIQTKWCGSELLYWMWVISMLITGISIAYCSVIGYIKVRDFAVANTRSQPPGWVGKSDYYVAPTTASPNTNTAPSDGDSSHSGNQQFHPNGIYQADGNPQFWGSHIYRPTQAAATVSNR